MGKKTKIKNAFKKEKSGQAFEKLMTVIASAFYPDSKVKHNIQLRERCGVNRQIDVSIEGRKNIIIECKDHQTTKVNMGEIGTFADLCLKTNSEGIFVSRKGFQKGAITKANEDGIKMYTLDTVDTQNFKNIFHFPEVSVFNHKINYDGWGLTLSPEYMHLIPFTPDDEFIYTDNGTKHKLAVFIERLFAESVLKIQLQLFLPLIQRYAPGNEKDILDKEHNEGMVCEIEFPHYIYFNKQKLRVYTITIGYTLILSLKHKERDIYHQKDLKQNVISEIITTVMHLDNKPHTLTVVSSPNNRELKVSLVPNYLSSEIIELEDLGELKKPL